ncbi:transposase [Methylobacter sp. Wu1]|uniref:transposase n=1 Tax=Methylobacter sp. Wu1 TaxID=3119359 RepID=UPI002F9279CE
MCENICIPWPKPSSRRCGKSSADWFYGFKLHLIVNDQGEIVILHHIEQCE